MKLILIPTEFEAQAVRRQLTAPGSTLELCGFGPIVAAARAQQAIAQHQPSSVLLLGIAGAYSPQLEVGSAYEFSEVACYGVGVGTGTNFQSAQELGWMQWQSGPASCLREGERGVGKSIADRLPLDAHHTVPELQLLTVCAAADGPGDVSLRTARFPLAVAEDMEGFAVAVACHLANVPVRIIRGISNRAGDRQHARWLVAEALGAAAQVALEY